MIKQRTIADSLRGYSLDELRKIARACGGTPNDAKTRHYGPYKRRPYVPPQEEPRRSTWSDPNWGSAGPEPRGAEQEPRPHNTTKSRNTDHRGSVHHRVLGVPGNATRDEIRSAYRAMAMKYHPDHGGSVDKMREINLAYDALQGVAQ